MDGMAHVRAFNTCFTYMLLRSIESDMVGYFIDTVASTIKVTEIWHASQVCRSTQREMQSVMSIVSPRSHACLAL